MKKVLFILSLAILSSCASFKTSHTNQSLDFHTDRFHTDVVESILSFYEDNDSLSLDDIYIPEEFMPTYNIIVKKSEKTLRIVQNDIK